MRVSVIMAVCNGEKYLREAIESILNQTFADFEFLIIDDGSTDESPQIIQSYGDGRIRTARNEKNLGLGKSLNEGIRLARGEYIVRMDADDISVPERLQEQVAYMDAHPEIGIAGSWIKLIGSGGGKVRKYPTDPGKILCHLLFRNVVVHPSVIIRKKALLDSGLQYDPSLKYSQDYDLWVRASRKMKISNMPSVLLNYRDHEAQVGKKFWKEQQKYVNQVCKRQLNELGIEPKENELLLHRKIAKRVPQVTGIGRNKVESWIARLSRANRREGIYPEPVFQEILNSYRTKTAGSLGNTARWLFRRLISFLK